MQGLWFRSGRDARFAITTLMQVLVQVFTSSQYYFRSNEFRCKVRAQTKAHGKPRSFSSIGLKIGGIKKIEWDFCKGEWQERETWRKGWE